MLIEIERAPQGTPDLSLGIPGADVLLAAITVSEIRVGILLADIEARRVARTRFLERLLQLARVIPFDIAEAEVHAEVHVNLRRAGIMIGAADLMIAATALANGHAVMTNNVREFERVPGLEVLAGPAGNSKRNGE